MKDGTIHFISGLPRSGSTLLSAILSQNPRFRAGIASPMLSVLNAIQPSISGGEFRSFFNDDRRASMIRGLFSGYYADTPNKIVFDSNRIWTANLPLIQILYPTARVICCVREPAWILDSFERIFRRNPLRTTAMTGFETKASLSARLESLAQGDASVLGSAWDALRAGWYGDHAKLLILIDYDRLVEAPDAVMDGLYDAIGAAPYKHDFKSLQYDEPDYDEANGVPGLHYVRSELKKIDRIPCLPPELFARYETPIFWRKGAEPDGGGRGALIL